MSDNSKLPVLPFPDSRKSKLKALSALRGHQSLQALRRSVWQQITDAPLESTEITITLEASTPAKASET